MLITGSNITTVGHYKDAAERHLHVCSLLMKQLDYPQNFSNTNKYQNILAELYYLSGYIVECSVNYKYLTTRGSNDSTNWHRNWGVDVDLGKHFRFDARTRTSSENILADLPSAVLPSYLKSLGNITTSILVGQDIVKKKMQQCWDPKVRYSYESTGLRFTTTSVDEIKIYFKAAKDLFNVLI